MGIGSFLSAGSAILGAIGKGKDKAATQQSGYSAAPGVVREGLEKTYWPDVMSNYAQMRDQPLARVMYDPRDLFASQGLGAQQMAADMRAGLIPQQEMIYQNGQLQPATPFAAGQQPQAQMPTQQQGGGSADMDQLRGMLYLATGYGGQPGQKPSPLDTQRMQNTWGSSPEKLAELGRIVAQYGRPTNPEYAKTVTR